MPKKAIQRLAERLFYVGATRFAAGFLAVIYRRYGSYPLGAHADVIERKSCAYRKAVYARLLIVVGPNETTLGTPVGRPPVSFNISRSVLPSMS